jgi:Domain of unknown function (DUF1996)
MLALALAAFVAALGLAHADFASRCFYLGRARIDPIVSRGVLNSHEHTFFGSDSVSAYTSTGAELTRDSACSSCGDPSSYWFPSLFQDARYVRVAQASVYWSNSLPGTNDFQNITLMPLGLRMVEGSPFATNASESAPFYDWYCFDSLTAGHKTAFPTCRDKMRLSLRFPSCWNGVDRYLPRSAHMAHPYSSGDCPAGFRRTWSLRLEVDFAPDGRGGRISLGAPNITTPYATHADFFNGLSRTAQRRMMKECGCLGGDYCNVRPLRDRCAPKYLDDSQLHMP